MRVRSQGRLLAGMVAVLGLFAAGNGCQSFESMMPPIGSNPETGSVNAFAIRPGSCCCSSGGLFSFLHPNQGPGQGMFVGQAGQPVSGVVPGTQTVFVPGAAGSPTVTYPSVTVTPGGFVPLKTTASYSAGAAAPGAMSRGVPVGTPGTVPPVMLRPVPPGAPTMPSAPPVIASSWQPVQHLVIDPSVIGPDLGGTPPAGSGLRQAEDVPSGPLPSTSQAAVELGPPAGTAIASSATDDKAQDRKAITNNEDSNLSMPRPLVPVPMSSAAVPFSAHGFSPGGSYIAHPPKPSVPREFAKQALPPYVIEPPDILLIEASRAITDPIQPLAGQHLVRPDGTISLGVNGTVPVAGLTVDQVRDAIAATLLAGPLKNAKKWKDPKSGDEYGPPSGGWTLENVKAEVNVDVLAYNSKFYYIITDGGGYGAQVYRFPVTGNETVLDALAQVNGLPTVASKKKIWLARATYNDHMHPKVFPVDWCGMVKRGSAETNYQIYPNDRLYVESDCLIRTDTAVSKFLSPILRGFGATLLGASTVNAIKSGGNVGGGAGGLGTGGFIR